MYEELPEYNEEREIELAKERRLVMYDSYKNKPVVCNMIKMDELNKQIRRLVFHPRLDYHQHKLNLVGEHNKLRNQCPNGGACSECPVYDKMMVKKLKILLKEATEVLPLINKPKTNE